MIVEGLAGDAAIRTDILDCDAADRPGAEQFFERFGDRIFCKVFHWISSFDAR